MASVRRAEQKRLYSWWWDSHISPKNSKWLKENLTDMDSKVKAMIKLLEEDGDSFAKKAEMYYKKRPELMKLVEEFYRAYRALAERYDHATGVLRQAQRTMSEAFPNQIPLGFMDDSPSPHDPLGNEVEPHTPEMHPPERMPIDPDDMKKDALGLSSDIHLHRKGGQNTEESGSFSTNKGLKQLNDIFGPGNEPTSTTLPEGRAGNGLNFQEEEEENSVNKENTGSSELQSEVQERENAGDSVKGQKQDISRLSTKNLNVKNLIMEESERATKAENELRLLNETLSEFRSKKESDILECQYKISNLENQLINSQNDVKKLNDRMTSKVKKLYDAEELNQSLQMRYVILEKKLNRQENELNEKQAELEKLLVTLEDKRQQCMHVETALLSKENLLGQSEEALELSRIEIKKYTEKLKDMEMQNMGLQDEICNINEENKRLNDQNTHLNQVIQELDAEIILLKEKIRKLDELHAAEIEILHQEVDNVKKDRDDLERRHQDLKEQISVMSESSEALQASLMGCENENSELKELCKNHETDKEALCKKLESLETVLEKNMVLENSLSDANVELDDFREKNAILEKLRESLTSEILICIHEKEALASQVENLTQNVEKFSEENSSLENSMSTLKAELAHAISKLMDSAEICQSLEDTKTELIAEKDALISQVESCTLELQSKEVALGELKEENMDLSTKMTNALNQVQKISHDLEDKETTITKLKDEILELSSKNNLALNQVRELRDLLKVEEKEHKITVQSYESQLTTLTDRIQLLVEQNLLKQKDLEQEQDNFAGASMEIFILKSSLSDLCERNLVLSVEGQKHHEAFRSFEKLASQLEEEKHMQMRDIALLSDHNEKLRKGVNLLKNALICDKESSDVEMKDEMLMSIAMDEIHRLMTFVSEAEAENQQKYLEISILLTFIRQIGLDVANLKSDNYSLGMKLEIETQKLSASENKTHELTYLNEKLTMDIQASTEREELQMLQMNVMTSFLASVVSELKLDITNLLSQKFHLERDQRVKAEELLALKKQQHDLVGETKQLMKEVEASNLREELLEQQTGIEISVLLTLLKQFQFDLNSTESAKRTLEIEFDIRTEKLLALENKNHEFVDLNNQLKKDLEACRYREEQMYLELLVLSTLLKQMAVEVINLRLENVHFEKENQMSSEKILELEEKKHELIGQNEKLIKNVESGNKREEILKTELQDLQAIIQTSKCEISILIEEKKMKTEELRDMKQKHNVLEEETSDILAEALKLDHLYEFYRCLSAERLLELHSSLSHIDSLSLIKSGLDSKVTELSRNIIVLESEKMDLTHDVAHLEEEFRKCLLILLFDLNMVTRMCEEINDRAENMKNQLMSKEKELSEASQKCDSSFSKNKELGLLLEGLQLENDRVKLLREELEKKVTSLSEALSLSKAETGEISEANHVLQTEMSKMHEKVDQLMSKEKHLMSELRKEIDMVEHCEEDIVALLANNQIATVYAAIYEEKVCELLAEMEISSIVDKEILNLEFVLTNKYVDELLNKLEAVERENCELTANIDDYSSLVTSLEKAIALLGEQIKATMKRNSTNYLPEKDAAVLSHQDYQTRHLNEDHQSRDTARVLLEMLIVEVEALRKVIVDAGSTSEHDRSCLSSGLIVENKEIEGLKQIEYAREEHVVGTSITQGNDTDEVMISDEITGKRGLRMKDIEVDHSSSATYMNVESYGVRTSNSEINDQLWEAAESHSNNHSTNKPSLTQEHVIEVLEREPSRKLVAVEEVNTYELEVPKRVLATQELSQKILKGLNSDAQKLSELSDNIEELKTKMGRFNVEKFPANFGLDTLKAQLKAAEGLVTELIDINKNLIKKAEGNLSSDGMETKPEENGNGLRRPMSEQARRQSDKVGRLELELQKIQYVLLKLEEEYENQQYKSSRQRTRVLLRDYLYGENKRKYMMKRHFCGCMRPKTKDDY